MDTPAGMQACLLAAYRTSSAACSRRRPATYIPVGVSINDGGGSEQAFVSNGKGAVGVAIHLFPPRCHSGEGRNPGGRGRDVRQIKVSTSPPPPRHARDCHSCAAGMACINHSACLPQAGGRRMDSSLRWNDDRSRNEFVAIPTAPWSCKDNECAFMPSWACTQSRQGAQTNLMISARTVTLMPRNAPSLMVSFCSISLIAAPCSLMAASC